MQFTLSAASLSIFRHPWQIRLHSRSTITMSEIVAWIAWDYGMWRKPHSSDQQWLGVDSWLNVKLKVVRFVFLVYLFDAADASPMLWKHRFEQLVYSHSNQVLWVSSLILWCDVMWCDKRCKVASVQGCWSTMEVLEIINRSNLNNKWDGHEWILQSIGKARMRWVVEQVEKRRGNMGRERIRRRYMIEIWKWWWIPPE